MAMGAQRACWMSTIPTERRKGLGTILMINALERIRQRNIR